jgi:hypothetical protein
MIVTCVMAILGACGAEQEISTTTAIAETRAQAVDRRSERYTCKL